MVGVTGPIYVIRRSDLDEVPSDTVLDDMWIPMRLRLGGRLLLLCPEATAYDTAFGNAREFSRKARTLAGNFQLLSRMPQLLWPPANPSWFETVSHKVLRLVSPWALLLLRRLDGCGRGTDGRPDRACRLAGAGARRDPGRRRPVCAAREPPGASRGRGAQHRRAERGSHGRTLAPRHWNSASHLARRPVTNRG